MRINVAQLLKAHSGESKEYDMLEEIGDLDPEIAPLGRLTGQVQLIRSASGIFVHGTLRTSIELECSRCLESFSYPLKFNLEEEFYPSVDIATGASLPREPEAETATTIDSRHILDLTEVVRQNLLLAIPPHPVCRNTCMGLCQECGQRLDVARHQHVQVEIDPRLQILEQLK